MLAHSCRPSLLPCSLEKATHGHYTSSPVSQVTSFTVHGLKNNCKYNIWMKTRVQSVLTHASWRGREKSTSSLYGLKVNGNQRRGRNHAVGCLLLTQASEKGEEKQLCICLSLAGKLTKQTRKEIQCLGSAHSSSEQGEIQLSFLGWKTDQTDQESVWGLLTQAESRENYNRPSLAGKLTKQTRKEIQCLDLAHSSSQLMITREGGGKGKD